MADPRYASRLRYLDAADVDDAVVSFDGLDIVDAEGQRIGGIDGFVVDADARRVNHIVVDSGGWFTSGRLLLPIGHAVVASDRKSLRTDVTRDALRRLPEFDADRFSEFTDEELHAFERHTVIACCPDEPLEAVSTSRWGYESWGHYRQPEWWGMIDYPSERLRSLASMFAASCSADRLATVASRRRR
jgi:sporulation protein YlmC with PRC-barrel domain